MPLNKKWVWQTSIEAKSKALDPLQIGLILLPDRISHVTYLPDL